MNFIASSTGNLVFIVVHGSVSGGIQLQSGDAQLGESCGGAAIPPAQIRQCAAGLICTNEAHDVTFPGTCTAE